MPLNIFFYISPIAASAAGVGGVNIVWAFSERPIGMFDKSIDVATALLAKPTTSSDGEATLMENVVNNIVVKHLTAEVRAALTADHNLVLGSELTAEEDASVRALLKLKNEETALTINGSHMALTPTNAHENFSTMGGSGIVSPTPADAAAAIRGKSQVNWLPDGGVIVEGVPKPPVCCGGRFFAAVESKFVPSDQRIKFFTELADLETKFLDRENSANLTLILTQATIATLITALQVAMLAVNGGYASDKSASTATNLGFNLVTVALTVLFGLFTIYLNAVKGEARTHQDTIEGIQQQFRKALRITDGLPPVPVDTGIPSSSRSFQK